MDTVAAAKAAGEAIRVLIDGGITDEFQGLHAAMSLTMEGDTPERHAILEGLRK